MSNPDDPHYDWRRYVDGEHWYSHGTLFEVAAAERFQGEFEASGLTIRHFWHQLDRPRRELVKQRVMTWVNALH